MNSASQKTAEKPRKKKFVSSRFLSIAIALAIHGALLFCIVFTVTTVENRAEEKAGVLKLADIRERPPEPSLPKAASRITEGAALPAAAVETGGSPGGSGFGEDFLPMHLVSELPRFSEQELRKRLLYPEIAQRAGIEGTVYLELFVDAGGSIKNIAVLKEDPPGRGFGEAAVRGFWGLKAVPAKANGVTVAVKYRYPVRFSLKG